MRIGKDKRRVQTDRERQAYRHWTWEESMWFWLNGLIHIERISEFKREEGGRQGDKRGRGEVKGIEGGGGYFFVCKRG